MFSIYGSNVNRDSPAVLRLPLDKDPIAWWGAYVPLESWTPPKLRKSKFKGVVRLADYPHFKKYDLENEFPAGYENTDDPIAKRDQDMYLLESMWTSDIMVHMVSPLGFTADNTGRNDQDLQDCAWDNPSSEGSPKDPYASQWGYPSHDVGITSSSELMANAYNCGWDDPMHYEIITLPGRSRDDLYDCGWNDPMNHQFIMESSADAYDCGWDDPKDHHTISTDDSAEDQYDCGWGDPMDTNKPSTAVMAEQHCGDVNLSVAKDLYDCRWDAVCLAGMQEMNTMSSNMQNILCDIPSEAYAVFGMRMHWIMEQLDNMIAICERDGWAT
ncbi:hypothetical protein BDR06DRAFT_972438 [Suillus hirtellus]|nr:hypothetical protein BDR06DRAFT_972438 [Suillus hirtellus]